MSLATITVERSGPGWLPGPGPQGAVDRETLWYDYAVGVDDPAPAPWVLHGSVGDPAQPEPISAADLLADAGDILPWPRSAWLNASLVNFPLRGPSSIGGDMIGLACHALSVVRRDPQDPYNDHRAYASPRCAFPVMGAVVNRSEWHALDPERRQVVRSGVASDPQHAGGAISLSGRYDRIPSAYGWFRGSLVGIESGIVLRHLAALSRLHHLPLDVALPQVGWTDSAPAHLWRDNAGWSPPIVLTPRDTARQPARTRRPRRGRTDHCADAEADLLRVYRSHDFTHSVGALGDGIPAEAEDDAADSWAEVLWRRSAGRMPRGLYGFRVANAGMEASDAVAITGWGTVQPPVPVAAAAMPLRLYAVVRDVGGLSPGIYDVVDGHFSRRATAPGDALDRFAASYLYGSDQFSRNDMERAPLVLVVTSRPRDAVVGAGPSAWTALQLATGWVAHGLCLGAAARRLMARPVRALDEYDVAVALDLDDDEMVGLAVVVSQHSPHGGLQIDLRS